MPSSGKDKAPTKKAPVKMKPTVMNKGTKKMAAKQPDGKRTMMGGGNRTMKKGKISEDTEC